MPEFSSMEEAEAYFQKQIDEKKKAEKLASIKEYQETLAREGNYDSLLFRANRPSKTVEKQQPTKPKPNKIQKAQDYEKEKRANKYGSAGLGGLDKDGLGDAMFKTLEQLFK
jgi:hypothetical protein